VPALSALPFGLRRFVAHLASSNNWPGGDLAGPLIYLWLSAGEVFPVRGEHDCRENKADDHVHDGAGAECQEGLLPGTRQFAEAAQRPVMSAKAMAHLVP
jgi:hypothetical protein